MLIPLRKDFLNKSVQNNANLTWEKDIDRRSQQRNNEMAQFLKIKEIVIKMIMTHHFYIT